MASTESAPEIWKTIDGFSKYECSSNGRIKNTKSARIFTCKQIRDRYITVGLVGDDGKYYSKSVHRIVASLFVPKLDPKCTQVNHKDKIICNNAAINLEWVTPSQNVIHSFAVGVRKAMRKRTFVSSMDGFVSVGITDYEHYKINREGILISKTGCILNKAPGRAGYLRISIKSSKNVRLNTSIHRLVAITFIPNPENKPMVNHKNGNRADNRVENLEWATQSENMIHAHEYGLISSDHCARQIYRLELNGTIKDEWISADIIEKFSKNIGGIWTVCRSYVKSNIHNSPESGQSSSKGYGWCFIDCFKDPVPNPSLLRVFPDIDVNDQSINYDMLRPFVRDTVPPVWQLDLDGERIKLWRRSEINIDGFDVGTDAIGLALKNNSASYGYGWTYANYKDILEPDLEYEKIITTTVLEYGLDFTRDIDFSLLRDSIKNGYEGKPVWEINVDGCRVKKWATRAEAERFHGLGRNAIEQALKGQVYKTGDKIWEWATFYMDDNTSDYNIVPLASRFDSKSKKGKMIEQYDMKDNLIATFTNMKDANSEMKFDICLSYPHQNGFVFKPKNKVFIKPRHNGIIQRELSGEIVRIWQCSIREIERNTRYDRLMIGKWLNGQSVCKDHIWEYAD
jgi:hypothetical protein